jgi:hypothetical protein
MEDSKFDYWNVKYTFTVNGAMGEGYTIIAVLSGTPEEQARGTAYVNILSKTGYKQITIESFIKCSNS